MPILTVIHGEQVHEIEATTGETVGEAIARLGLPLEQPCAGQGTCGKCKLLSESGLAPPDEVERYHLSSAELALHKRLACRARIAGDARVLLAPVVVYSNKGFKANRRYMKPNIPLGLAIDLGSTTVAAYLVTLDDGDISRGAAALNQQAVYGADLISRLGAALRGEEHRQRLRRLALSSISQAIDALNLPEAIQARIERVSVVSNSAMHHLLTGLPLESLAALPFEPADPAPIRDARKHVAGLFSEAVQVSLPPLIGGFVGSDALACLAAYDFDRCTEPIACIDLGTNGEVLVTDGRRILATSTAAGPAFEGANISSGCRAVDGAVIAARIEANQLHLTTIGEVAPIGLTGSGLLSLIHVLRQAEVIEASGRFASGPPDLGIEFDSLHGARRLLIARNPRWGLSQWDIRELQKAKAAIRAAIDLLLEALSLQPGDLRRFILTGSFGGAVDIEAVSALGMLPPVPRERIEALPNGAGLGAAIFLTTEGFERGEALAARTEHIELNDEAFMARYVAAMRLDGQAPSA